MNLAAAVYHPIILYVLIYPMGMGFLGITWGTFITYFINSILVTVYCGWYRSDLKESFFFPTKESFEDLWDYFKLGLSSSAMISLEWWSYEL